MILVTLSAFAAPPVPVERAAVLLFSGCGVEGAPPLAVSDILSLELRAANIRLKGEDEGFGEGDLLLVVRGGCEASTPLVLRASLSGRERVRSLLLDDVPASARARTLAISLAELGELLISGAPPEPAPADAANAPGPNAAEEAANAAKPEAAAKPAAPAPAKGQPAGAPRRAPAPLPFHDERKNTLLAEPPREPSRDFIAVSLAGRWFGFEQVVLGGRARTDIGRVFFGGEALYGTARSHLGEVRGMVLDALAGVRVFSPPRAGLVSFAAGPRFGAGLVNVSGKPTDGVSSSAALELYFDAALTGDLRIETASPVGLTAAVEFGVARGVTALADGSPVAEFGGFFTGLNVGFGFGL